MIYHKPKLPAGFCRQKKWKLSYRQIRRKGCIDPKKQCHHNAVSQCRHLEKLDHPIWIELETKRQQRNERKQAKKEGE